LLRGYLSLSPGSDIDRPKKGSTTAVSALVPVRNEAANLAACLASVAWADEVVVVDSRSKDATAELAADLGAKVVQFEYSPGGPKKKNWALRHVNFRNEWILILDADERIPPALAHEIDGVVRDDGRGCAGYYINRRFYFAGRWIRHAGYFPSWNLRLLRRGAGEYEFVPDHTGETGDNEVHEHVLLKGRAGWLREPMDHYAYPNIQAFIEKHNRYSTWEARVNPARLTEPANNGPIALHLKARRAAKAVARRLPFPEAARFLYHYVLKLGFLDGAAGYVFCRLLAEYEFLIWAKAWEARREPANGRRT
jgi:glycosyltransferase involved in cell wall biosynthesis